MSNSVEESTDGAYIKAAVFRPVYRRPGETG